MRKRFRNASLALLGTQKRYQLLELASYENGPLKWPVEM